MTHETNVLHKQIADLKKELKQMTEIRTYSDKTETFNARQLAFIESNFISKQKIKDAIQKIIDIQKTRMLINNNENIMSTLSIVERELLKELFGDEE